MSKINIGRMLRATAGVALIVGGAGDSMAESMGMTVWAEVLEPMSISPRAAALHPVADVIAISSDNNHVRVWNFASNLQIAVLDQPAGSSDTLTSRRISFSPDGRLLVACHSRGADQKVLSVWETAHWQKVFNFNDSGPGIGCISVDFTSDSKTMIVALHRTILSAVPNLVAIDTRTFQTLWERYTVPFHLAALSVSVRAPLFAAAGAYGPPRSMALPRHAWAEAMSRGSYIGMFSAEDGKLLSKFNTEVLGNTQGSLAFSPDGREVLFANGNGWELRDAATGALTASVPAEPRSAKTVVAFYADGSRILQAHDSPSGFIKAWDRTGRLLWSDQRPTSFVTVRPDGLVAIGQQGKTIIGKLK